MLMEASLSVRCYSQRSMMWFRQMAHYEERASEQ